jgi:hypothetical protein
VSRSILADGRDVFEISEMTDSLLTFLMTERGDITFAELLRSMEILRTSGNHSLPANEGELREQLRALERAGRVAVEGDWVRYVPPKVTRQEPLF